MNDKLPFDIDEVMDRVREGVRPYPSAVLFELFDEGYTSAFEQTIACLITVRTLEETSALATRRLFTHARTPMQMLKLSEQEVNELIGDTTFHEAKARQILEIARRVVEEFGGEMPCDEESLLSLRGVGRKCTNLVLGIACGQPRVGVDIHVHRVTNRWGYVSAPTPEKTTVELEKKLPRRYWVEINRLLVPFGKYICTGKLPKCSTCPVLDWCRQVGVTAHR